MNALSKASLTAVLCCALAVGCKEEKKASKAGAATTATSAGAKGGAAKALAKPAAKSAPKVRPAAKGLDDEGAMQVSVGDKCPVCGMVVDKHKKFASAIALKDGTTYHFCGTGCMIKSWLHPEVFLGSKKEALARAVVPEYFGGKYVDALKARWVAGSDVVGPMGSALVALEDDAALATFKKRHGGKVTFGLAKLDDAQWEKITGKKAAMRPAKN